MTKIKQSELRRAADRLYNWLDRLLDEHCNDGIKDITFVGANDALSAYDYDKRVKYREKG